MRVEVAHRARLVLKKKKTGAVMDMNREQTEAGMEMDREQMSVMICLRMPVARPLLLQASQQRGQCLDGDLTFWTGDTDHVDG